MKDTDVEEIVDTVLSKLPRYCLTKNDGEWGLKRIEQGAYADVSDLDEILREALKQAEARGVEMERMRLKKFWNTHSAVQFEKYITSLNNKSV